MFKSALKMSINPPNQVDVQNKSPLEPPPHGLVNGHLDDFPSGLHEEPTTLSPPETLTRPLSAPSAPVPHIGLLDQKPRQSTENKDDLVTPPSQLSPLNRPTSSASTSSHRSQEDEKESGFAKRFVGNMLVTRLGRAGVQSVASTVKLPIYLSPWGDNNPFTLPNLRKRDLALAGVMHFGADALIGSSLTAVEKIVQHGASWTVEQGVDQGLEKVKAATPHRVVRTAGITNVEIRIKHKLIGEQAEVRLFEEREAERKLSCAKGWFCPYLYASGRALMLSRMKEFTFAEFLGPGLMADAALAPTLLSCITQEDAPVCHLDGPNYQSEDGNYQRAALFFLGISPYRTASAWSQARIPSEARLRFHLLTYIPAIVLPVKPTAPVCAWSPWTMGQIISGRDAYDAGTHANDIVRYLETIVETSLVNGRLVDEWQMELADSVRRILEGIKNMPSTLGSVSDAFDADRAGVVLFRY
ncbi:uncharacterized protein BCR38DRAFT_507374 [Pseudomassariella vexata]|uniref:Uncharacterized protein n=1 Tax=Pseudomassariella vexata TaxID=1141098 RepID=A0A1Y2EA56_9PEZI|nr:uncharacterized protein BCR38DRAFT_507374 [Pseudomassariella vexata]ORY68470.1 hypothetical protein BCR38DRAFT_507374 [Pseudomassariella vexata]